MESSSLEEEWACLGTVGGQGSQARRVTTFQNGSPVLFSLPVSPPSEVAHSGVPLPFLWGRGLLLLGSPSCSPCVTEEGYSRSWSEERPETVDLWRAVEMSGLGSGCRSWGTKRYLCERSRGKRRAKALECQVPDTDLVSSRE